jgi:hypothetical protein
LTGILAALAPVFLLILCGWGLRRGGWFGEAFWADVDRLVFYLLFPAYLVIRIATADLAGLSLAPMGLGVAAGLFAMAALAFLLKPLSGLDGPGFGAAFQGCMRPNIYVGFAAAEALFGVEGGVLAVIVVAVGTPLVNVFAAVVLTLYGPDGNGGWAKIAAALVRNPVILAIAAAAGGGRDAGDHGARYAGDGAAVGRRGAAPQSGAPGRGHGAGGWRLETRGPAGADTGRLHGLWGAGITACRRRAVRQPAQQSNLLFHDPPTRWRSPHDGRPHHRPDACRDGDHAGGAGVPGLVYRVMLKH